MSNFNNVKITKKPNIYFEGNVFSYSLFFNDGSRKTLGVMQAGEYKFNTEEKEIIEITSGKLKILIENESEWKNIESGMIFEVPASSSFKLKITDVMSYCCSYIQE